MSFSLDLSKAIKGIKKDKDKIVRGTLLAVVSNIVKRTPVGNPELWIYNAGTKESPRYVDYISAVGFPVGYVGGSLRGAWNASIGAIDESIGGSLDSAGKFTISDASDVIKSYKPGETFYLTNPLPYATRVEFGWSTQQPQGMLRRSLAEAEAAFDKASR